MTLVADSRSHPKSAVRLAIVLALTVLFRYLRPRDMILYDGALRSSFFEHFYAPTTGWKTSRKKQPAGTRANNRRIRKSRTIVEHWFGRIKTQFPIFDLWKRKLREITPAFFAAGALVNIKNAFVTPLRHHRCWENDCFWCYNVDHIMIDS
jgi:hypothetical protein